MPVVWYVSSFLLSPVSCLLSLSTGLLTTHAQDLCNAALRFSHETLKHGGHFICKFYQGSEDRQLEAKLKKLFAAVHREKPESSRSVRLLSSVVIHSEPLSSHFTHFIKQINPRTCLHDWESVADIAAGIERSLFRSPPSKKRCRIRFHISSFRHLRLPGIGKQCQFSL